MFWKKEEQAQKQEAPAAEKPCCSGKKQQAEEQAAAKEAVPQGLSTFEFGGAVVSGVKLVGDCQGSDPNAIQACRWSPTPGPTAKHTILF